MHAVYFTGYKNSMNAVAIRVLTLIAPRSPVLIDAIKVISLRIFASNSISSLVIWLAKVMSSYSIIFDMSVSFAISL